jgi:hypothetical protein
VPLLPGGCVQTHGKTAPGGFLAALRSVLVGREQRRADFAQEFQVGQGRSAFVLPLALALLRATPGHLVFGPWSPHGLDVLLSDAAATRQWCSFGGSFGN